MGRIVDALGCPMRFILTAGQNNDATQAASLLEGVQTECMIADKGCNSEKILEEIEEPGAAGI